MELNRYFDYEFDGDTESQADEIVHEAKETRFDYGTVEDKKNLDVKDYNYVNTVTHVYATKEEALEKAQELENEGKKKAEEKIFGEKR